MATANCMGRESNQLNISKRFNTYCAVFWKLFNQLKKIKSQPAKGIEIQISHAYLTLFKNPWWLIWEMSLHYHRHDVAAFPRQLGADLADFRHKKLKHMVQTWHETEHIPTPLCLWGFKGLQICWMYTFPASEDVYIPLQVVYTRDEVTFLKEHHPQGLPIIHYSCEHLSTHPPTSAQKEKYFHFSLPFAASAFISTLLLKSATPCCPLRCLLKYFPGEFCSSHHWSLSREFSSSMRLPSAPLPHPPWNVCCARAQPLPQTLLAGWGTFGKHSLSTHPLWCMDTTPVCTHTPAEQLGGTGSVWFNAQFIILI